LKYISSNVICLLNSSLVNLANVLSKRLYPTDSLISLYPCLKASTATYPIGPNKAVPKNVAARGALKPKPSLALVLNASALLTAKLTP